MNKLNEQILRKIYSVLNETVQQDFDIDWYKSEKESFIKIPITQKTNKLETHISKIHKETLFAGPGHVLRYSKFYDFVKSDESLSLPEIAARIVQNNEDIFDRFTFVDFSKPQKYISYNDISDDTDIVGVSIRSKQLSDILDRIDDKLLAEHIDWIWGYIVIIVTEYKKDKSDLPGPEYIYEYRFGKIRVDYDIPSYLKKLDDHKRDEFANEFAKQHIEEIEKIFGKTYRDHNWKSDGKKGPIFGSTCKVGKTLLIMEDNWAYPNESYFHAKINDKTYSGRAAGWTVGRDNILNEGWYNLLWNIAFHIGLGDISFDDL